MYQLVCVRNGQYGFVRKDNERVVLDHPYNTREDAAAALKRRYDMEAGVKDPDMRPERLEGTPEAFTVTVKKAEGADFTDHYFIEEV